MVGVFLRGEMKGNGIRFALFSHAQAKTMVTFFAGFRFVSLQIFCFASKRKEKNDFLLPSSLRFFASL
jgi:hypothetical protein